MQKLQAWPNNLGYTFGSWELVNENGRWMAANKPAFFGGYATEFGHGEAWAEAIATAKPTEEYADHLQRMADKAA